MAKTVIAAEFSLNASGAEGSVKSLKQQLREAQADVSAMADKFGLTSDQAQKAAKKAAELKDAIGDAKTLTDAFNPDAKFKSFSNAITGVVGGFSALQGAQAIFGDQSEDLAKTLAKVQGAMALSQGINSVLEAGDAFKILGGVIRTNVVSAFTTLRGAVIATGIGALAVGVGLLIANFDAVKKAVLDFIPGLKAVGDFIGKLINKITDFVGVTSDATRAQEKFIKDTEKQIKKTDEFLDSQGYKYDEFTQRKIKANLEYKKHELEIANDSTKLEAEKQKLLKAYRDKADYEIRQADKDRLAKKKEADDKLLQSDKDAADKKRKWQETQDNAENELGKSRDQRKQENVNNFNNTLKLLSDNYTNGVIANNKDIDQSNKDSTILNQSTVNLNETFNEEKLKNQKELINKTSGILMQFSDLVGKQTTAGKALAIAAATMDTYQAANSALKADYGVFGPAAQIARFASVAATIGVGIKNVREIARTKVPGGGGGGGNLPTNTGGLGAPIGAQMGATALQQAQINAAGSAAVQAFVLESDVSGNQERIERLNRAARIQ